MKKQKEFIGYGEIENLSAVLSEYACRNVFLVRGRDSYRLSGSEKAFKKQLAGLNLRDFFDFEVNPKIEDIIKGVKALKEHQPDLVIAVGGGSVIDMAKMVNILAAQEGEINSYLKGNKKIEKKPLPLIAVPTTCGSGSEATHFAAVYIDKRKFSLAHEFVLPDISIVDPQFTLSLSKYLIAVSAMDAFSQAIESYWSVNSTAESMTYSKEAIEMIIRNLADAAKKSSRNALQELSRAAHFSGKAINITKTTAAHALSYAITSYFNVNHGHAVSLTLPEIFIYNSQVRDNDVTDKRGAAYVRKAIGQLNSILGTSSAQDSKAKIINLMQEAGLATRLSAVGIKSREDLEKISSNVNIERLKNNPRLLNRRVLKEILGRIL
ncbi:MAG: alcohol dehydrogenase [Candidatus Omnitrophota bacterium]|nr:MAG: alcohol dehydrogenase [Candidatus Omnitrophota bacterium]